MATKEEKHIELIEAEKDDDYSNDNLYNITSWGADLSFRELINMYDEGEMVKPELQRKYVWDKAEASRFIDSLLLGLPVPSIFLARTKGEKKLIVDGYQRIMTIYDYVKLGVFSKDRKAFKLSNSEKINKRWRGKTFQELSELEKRKIRSTTIHAIIFEQKEPKDDDTSMYQIFERINTSGRTLLPQEIRNCVYQGKFNDLLFKLNKNKDWRELYGLKTEDSRMRDMEFILRFFALSHKNIKAITVAQISLKKYLNEFMGNEDSEKQAVLRKREEVFDNVMEFLKTNIGPDVFNNISRETGRVIKRFHPTIFDAISIATAHAIKENKSIMVTDIKERREKLLQDENFNRYTTERTTNTENIKGRIAVALKELYKMKYE